MSLSGIVGAARTLSYFIRREEITSHNLAQAGTPTFKSMRVTAHLRPGEESASPVQWTDWSQGRLLDTERPLDVALDGPGFFVVQTPRGERLTRGGSLKLDRAGRLCDLDGNPLLGRRGPVILFGTEMKVDAAGVLLVDERKVDELRVETVSDLNALTREEGGLFATTEKTVPVPSEITVVHQGQIEDANPDSILSLVDLIAIQRTYAANVQALKTMDRVLGIATSEVGDV